MNLFMEEHLNLTVAQHGVAMQALIPYTDEQRKGMKKNKRMKPFFAQ